MKPEETVAFIQNLLDSTRGSLDNESIESVLHFLKYDEYEMAYEILLLEIINNNIVVNNHKDILEIAKMLKLDVESVYKEDFWNRLTTYLK